MQFGLSVPHRGPLANPQAIRAIARNAEALGYDVLTVSDHIVVPRTIGSKYPYSPDGGWSGGRDGVCFEQLSLLNYVAGVTETARLLTSIMVVPHREPILAAKAIATADQLSGGRVELGIGTGWMAEEFALLKTAPFAERGAVTNEYIRAFKELWTAEKPFFDGEYVQFRDIFFEPKTLQPGGPRIWVGGESGRALRRLATLGDVWYPIAGGNPKAPLDTLAAYDAALAKLRQTADQVGRDPASIGLAYSAMAHSPREKQAADGARMLLTGSAAARQDDVAALAERGVETLIVNVAAGDLDTALARQAAFAEDVMAKFR
ncbi:MAG: TIGR03619 family F420-dependent LLM class oxidoreductase [Alphaproteobacteria bacterium]|nr:TIGR03619 family F420-dependent LLM class oxidoreductase [Alphaproteobacteria bacterium]MCB9928181.1 TIGR03619 family F420-dependent LLM class oxidoreductase [Alphaproteobacteria bacterium]